MFEAIRRARRAGILQKYQPQVAIILVLTLLVAALNAVEPLVLKYVFDDLQRGGTMHRLFVAIGILAGIGIVREILSARANYRTWRTRLALHHELLDITVTRLHRLPMSFYRNEGVGAIMTRLDRGINGVVEAASQIAFSIVPAVVFLLITIVVMLQLDWRLAIVVLVLAPLPPLIATKASPHQTERERVLLERWMRIYSRFNEVLSGIMTVKSFTREHEEKRRFINDVAAANGVVMQGVKFDAAVGASQNLIVTVARVAALLIGGAFALKGEITVGTLVAFLGYVGSVFAPVQGLSSVYRTIRTGSVSMASIREIIDVEQTIGDAPDARELGPVEGHVRFDDVHFAYGARSVLRGIHLDVSPGEMVALVGPSGGGKSTMMSLLQRFYDPDGGRILVDGADIRAVKQHSLRENIGVVLQEALLFDDTVANNIAYGAPRATQAEIVAAARAAHADAFVTQLPNGYDSTVGERGTLLSVGERQRVAIARALLKDPPILILDEATSALDAETEAIVQDALERLMKGRTVFVIAHRLSTVVNADRVCVLSEGKIVEMGSHEDLMEQRGLYASLVDRQTRGLLPTRSVEDGNE